MSTINITNARKDLYHLAESVSLCHEPALIVGEKQAPCLYQRKIGVQYKKPYIWLPSLE